MISTESTTALWEIWLLVPDSHNELLNGCGLFRSRVDAECVAAALGDWFALAIWNDELMDQFDPITTDDLWYLREGLVRDGSNLAAVRVKVQAAVPIVNDFGTAFALYFSDDEDADDTQIVDLDVIYSHSQGHETA